MEVRTLLAADLALLASATPFTAAELSRLDLDSFQSMGASVPVFSGDWIVKFAVGSFDASLAGSLAQAGDSLAAHVSGLTSVRGLASTDTFLIHTTSGYTQQGITSALADIRGFVAVEPNFLAWKNDTTPNDPSFPTQWALHNTGQLGGLVDADIDAPAAWDINTGSGQAVVGVLDSGVDYTHPDLNDNMWRNPGEIPGDGIDNEGNGFVDDVFGYDFLNGDSDPLDDEGHGTSVAGIIAAEGNNALGVSGVNWDAQIMALKIFDPFGFAGTAQIVGAINYATMMKHEFGVDVIATNNSWGTIGFSTVLRDAIAAAGLEDILFVASAGNQQHNNDVAPQYPASYDLDNIISVAATDRFDNKASFTSFGPTTVDLGAPGVSTFTTAMGGGYRNFSGTSASSPYVAGVAALVHDTYPKASALDVKNAILNGVDHIASMAGITLSGGRLNLFGALKAMPAQVVAASPDEGDVVSAPPVSFTIETAFAIDPSTVQASDLTVNGLAANGVTVVNPTTLTFTFTVSPVVNQGAQQITVAAGAFTRQFDSQGVEEFVATFRYDALPLQVLSTLPAAGFLLPWPVTSIQLNFNEAINPLSAGTTDLQTSEGHVAGFTVIDNDTIEYQLAGVASDRRLTVTLLAGAVTDGFGNPNLAYTTTLDVDVNTIAAPAFERLEPLGSLILVSRADGRLTDNVDSDQFTFFAEAGETVAVRVTPQDPAASVAAGFGGIGTPAAAGPNLPLVLGPFPVNTDGVVTLAVIGDRATDYRVEIFRNAAIESPVAGPPQDISSSGIEIGSTRFAVVGSIAPPQIDRYQLDLGASLGRRVDIVLAGQDGAHFAGATLELVAPDGTITTALVDPLGNGATNYDLAILGFVPDQVGLYQLWFSSPTKGEYGLVVTEQLLQESEVNDGPLGVLRSLDGVDGAAGFIDSTGRTGTFEFIVDATRSSIAITGGVGDPNVGILAPFLPQAPGSMQSILTGTVEAIVSDHSIQLLPKTTVEPVEKPGPFQPGNAPADFAASLNVPPIIVGGVLAMRDTGFGMFGDLPIDASGNFAANDLSFALRQTLSAIIPGVFNDTVQVDDTFVDNAALAPGSLHFVNGRLELTLPVQVRLLIPVPQVPLAGIFDLVAQVVATAIVPGADDFYTVSLAPGETLVIETRTPFAAPVSSPGNPINPALRLLDGSGTPVAADFDSALDGRNALMKFTSSTGGIYKVQVFSTAGDGEYVLDVSKNLPPQLDPIPDFTVLEGTTVSFTAQATDPDLDNVTYHLAPGAPAGAAINPITGQFTWTPHDNNAPLPITVIATDDGVPQLSHSRTLLVTVYNADPVITGVILAAPPQPKEGDLIKLAVFFKDAGTSDTHTALVNWGDGTSSVGALSESGGSGKFLASHVISGGTSNITFKVTDDDLGSATGTRTLSALGVGIHDINGVRTLQVFGSGGPDFITLNPSTNGKVNIYTSFLKTLNRSLPLAGVQLIDVRGSGGNDTITLGTTPGVVLPRALVDGGDGDDMIFGGNGGNVLLGGRGNDTIYAGSARSILIGGQGGDNLYGNVADDIVIGGTTSFDSPGGGQPANDAALLLLLGEWQSNRTFPVRTANIVGGAGPILGGTGILLKKGLTVFDDSSNDWLWGSGGTDWFFHDSRDTALDKIAGEKTNG